jgi:glycosyltransferase 2 family protein
MIARYIPARLNNIPRPIWLIGRGLIAVTLCAILIRSLDLSLLIGKFNRLDSSWLGACLITPFLGIGLSAVRWQIALAILGIRRPLRELLLRYWTGAFYNTVLPGTIGGDVIRIGGLTRSGVPIAQSSLSVFADRVIGLWASMLLGLVSSLWASWLPHAQALRWVFGMIVLGGVLSFLLLPSLATYVPARLHRHVMLTRSLRARKLGEIVLVACVFQFLVIVQFYAAVQALQAPISLLACAVYAPAVVLATMLPLSLNGIGVREGALIVLLAGLGISIETATVVGLLIFATSVASSLPGGLAALALSKKPSLVSPAQ